MRFTFLVLEEHPYGREMLRILLERGYRPDLVVQEVSDLADQEREKFLDRIAGQPVPPTLSDLIMDNGIALRQVSNHNGLACRDILDDLSPDLVLLGGTRIIRPLILELFPGRIVNAHPGLLPQLRGSSSVAWALQKDLPMGATTHFVEAAIDEGPIILRRRLSVHRGETYEQIVRRMLTLTGELMAETLETFLAGEVQAIPQDPAHGETFRVIPPELLAQAKERLLKGTYQHYHDGKGDHELYDH